MLFSLGRNQKINLRQSFFNIYLNYINALIHFKLGRKRNEERNEERNEKRSFAVSRKDLPHLDLVYYVKAT